MNRDLQTIRAMVQIYCRAHHGGQQELCASCAKLQAYAEQRLAHCPLQAHKPVCSKCRIHCYADPMREQIQAVMRFAGPRMLTRHPLLALRHLVLMLRKAR